MIVALKFLESFACLHFDGTLIFTGALWHSNVGSSGKCAIFLELCLCEVVALVNRSSEVTIVLILSDAEFN